MNLRTLPPVLLLISSASGFGVLQTGCLSTRAASHGTLAMVVDPATMGLATLDADLAMEVGAVIFGAAAGAMSQMPRMQELERELVVVKEALTASEVEMADKIHILEEKLFAMDSEFEEQTARFQKQYDQTQRKNMEAFKKKLKTEMQFKVEIQLAQEKSDMLLKKASNEHRRTEKQEALSELKVKHSKLQDLNHELESALKTTDAELERLREAAKKKKSLFSFW